MMFRGFKHRLPSAPLYMGAAIAVAVLAGGCNSAVTSLDDLPTMTYTAQGKVISLSTGESISGIKVSRFNAKDAAGIYTDTEGNFLIEGTDSPRDTINLFFTDVDGNMNGSFLTKKSNIILTKSESSSDPWYDGRRTATNLVIQMEEDKSGL